MAKTKIEADRPSRVTTEPGEHWDEMARKPGWQAHLRYGANRKQRRQRHPQRGKGFTRA